MTVEYEKGALYVPTAEPRVGLGVISAGIGLGLVLFFLVNYGPGFLIAGWPAFIIIGIFGLVQLLLLLQRNQFGIYEGAIAPTYKPWSMWGPSRLVIPLRDVAGMTVRSIEDPAFGEAEKRGYFECEIALRNGVRIAFSSHGAYRGLRRQLKSEDELVRVRELLEELRVRSRGSHASGT